MNYEVLRSIRRRKGIRVQDLAQSVGVSRGLMGRIERGLADPRISTLEAIAKELGVEIRVVM